jgi:hypothetical protein
LKLPLLIQFTSVLGRTDNTVVVCSGGKGLAAKIGPYNRILSEQLAYHTLQDCPVILKCYGAFTLDNTSMDKGESLAILFMEQASNAENQ